MSEWKTLSLGDITSRLSSGKNISASKISDLGKYPVYGGNGLRGYTNESNFSGECAIIGRQGAMCGNVRYFSGEAYMTEHAIVCQANDQANTRFLAYLLPLLNLNRLSGQSAQPGLSVTVIKKQLIKIPSKSSQDKISAILSSLDDKIETNRAINARLEELASAIFKLMLTSDHTGDEETTIGEYLTPKRGKNLLSKDALNGDIPVVAGGLEPACYHNIANTQSPVITISASGANAGFVNLWGCSVWSSDSSYIDTTHTPYVYFWYHLLKNRQKEIYDSQTGSAQPHIYPQHISALIIKRLNIEKVKQFNDLVTPLYDKIWSNRKENARLTSLRDTLLPRLMSGELIPEIPELSE